MTASVRCRAGIPTYRTFRRWAGILLRTEKARSRRCSATSACPTSPRKTAQRRTNWVHTWPIRYRRRSGIPVAMGQIPHRAALQWSRGRCDPGTGWKHRPVRRQDLAPRRLQPRRPQTRRDADVVPDNGCDTQAGYPTCLQATARKSRLSRARCQAATGDHRTDDEPARCCVTRGARSLANTQM